MWTLLVRLVASLVLLSLPLQGYAAAAMQACAHSALHRTAAPAAAVPGHGPGGGVGAIVSVGASG